MSRYRWPSAEIRRRFPSIEGDAEGEWADLTKGVGKRVVAKVSAPKIHEVKDFQPGVIKLSKLFGWLLYHTHNSKRSGHGFPDLVMLRRGRMIVAELKTESKLSGEQEKWLDAFKECVYPEVYVWRPADLGRIAEILR